MPVDQIRSSRSKTHPRNLPMMMAGAGYMARVCGLTGTDSALTLEAA